jgi:hypothetical protein
MTTFLAALRSTITAKVRKMYESTFEGYMLFRMTEAEHVRKAYPDWVESSSNAEYEKHLWDSDPHSK